MRAILPRGQSLPHAGGCPATRRSLQEPYKQGQLDGLCGLYSAINALALLAARAKPLSAAACTRLFHQGLTIIAAATPLGGVVVEGMDPDLWFDVVQQLAAAAGNEVALGFDVIRMFEGQPNVTYARMRQAIERAIDERSVVLVSLGGAHNHYTLVARHTATRYVLHDSGHLHWLHKAACGSARSRQRHQIAASWVLALGTAES